MMLRRLQTSWVDGIQRESEKWEDTNDERRVGMILAACMELERLEFAELRAKRLCLSITELRIKLGF